MYVIFLILVGQGRKMTPTRKILIYFVEWGWGVKPDFYGGITNKGQKHTTPLVGWEKQCLLLTTFLPLNISGVIEYFSRELFRQTACYVVPD